MKLSEKIVQKYVDGAWELLELIKMAEQTEKENEGLKSKLKEIEKYSEYRKAYSPSCREILSIINITDKK